MAAFLSYNGGKDHRLPDRPDTGAACLPGGPHRAGLHLQPLLNVVPLTYDKNGIVTGGRRRGLRAKKRKPASTKFRVRQVENLPAEVTYPVNKLLLTGDPADMPHVEELMQQEFAGKLSICRSAPFFIETMPLGVGKDTSLEILPGPRA